MDLLTTHTHDSELQAITASPLTTTAPSKPFPACYVFIDRFLAKASNSGDFSASRAHVLSSQPHVQNSSELSSTNFALAYNISTRTT
jgi:hypothetical protein